MMTLKITFLLTFTLLGASAANSVKKDGKDSTAFVLSSDGHHDGNPDGPQYSQVMDPAPPDQV